MWIRCATQSQLLGCGNKCWLSRIFLFHVQHTKTIIHLCAMALAALAIISCHVQHKWITHYVNHLYYSDPLWFAVLYGWKLRVLLYWLAVNVHNVGQQKIKFKQLINHYFRLKCTNVFFLVCLLGQNHIKRVTATCTMMGNIVVWQSPGKLSKGKTAPLKFSRT